MWISKREFNSMKYDIKTLEENGKLFAQQSNKIQDKYDRLLKHLGLSEWTEPATPEKVVLITDKERAKRTKAGKKSYTTTQVSQQWTLADALGYNRFPPEGTQMGLSGLGGIMFK